MKTLLKRHIKKVLIAIGLLMTVFYGMKVVQLGMSKPVPEIVAEGASPEVAAAAQEAFTASITKWNNQFARKGFFTLIGLFLTLLGALPKKHIVVPKLVFSSGLVALIIHHLLADGKITSIAAEGFAFSFFWLFMAFVVKGTGMWCTIWRWKVLLEGQGFKIPLKHLIESFLIGRFIGSFAPGTSGLDGYRAYDISRYTGKVARSVSVIFVEKLVGFFVLGTLLLIAVPVGQTLFAEKSVNSTALVMLGLFFSGMMLASLVLLFQPKLFRWVLDLFIPKASPVRGPFDKAIKAVTAYEKHKLHLAKAALIGFGVHCCTIVMYSCTARFIGQSPDGADLFVTGALMIGATVLPLSIAGIGMREGVFAFFLGPISAIYAFTGYLVGQVISLFGGPVWLARKGDYYEVLKAQRDAINAEVDDEDEEENTEQDQETQKPAGPLPNLVDYTLTGLGAGLVAGVLVAIFDAVRLWLIAGGGADWSLPGYAALLYGPFLGVLGAATGAALGILGRLVQRPAAPRGHRATFIGSALFLVFGFVIGVFYLYRDVFAEQASGKLLGAIAGLGLGLLVVCVVVSIVLRLVFKGNRERFASWWVGVAFAVVATGVLLALGAGSADGSTGAPSGPAPEGAAKRPNVLLVMNDTHRADYVGAYTGEQGLTPNLDALAADGVLYENAFAQASWTRPSVATILTGRFPSSHTAIHKGSQLPSEITTLAEAMEPAGYENIGIVTNYNLTPFFNFDQGFHDYRYLTPNLPLGSTDTQSKLIFIEVVKKIQAKLRGQHERPEDYYVIGETVTAEALERLDTRDESRPFFMFLSYMDVHDPYFRHPFDGYAISHRAHPNPDISMAEEMKELYRGEVEYWDGAFGALIDGLKERGLYDDTLIIACSDHGEEFGEHEGFWHGTTLYSEQLRIFFIVKYHASSNFSSSKGATVDSWIRLVDMAPLVLNQVGLDIPEEMQGVANLETPRIPVFAEEEHQGNILKSVRYMDESTGEELKLIDANPGNPRGLEPNELYEMKSDPDEKRNLAGGAAEKLTTAQRMLEIQAKAAAEGKASGQTGELSAADKAVLEKLGYMEDEKK